MADFDFVKLELNTNTETDTVFVHGEWVTETTETWVDLTSDWQTSGYGWTRADLDNQITSRVAKPGRFDFKLNNSDTNSAGLAGYYSPGHANCLEGFGIGKLVRLTYCYDGLDFVKWRGRIESGGIIPDAGIYGSRKTSVSCVDIVDEYSKSIDLPTLASDKTAADVSDLVTAYLGVSPQATNHGTMTVTNSTVFDATRTNAAAISEVVSAIIAERGYWFMMMDRENGETITTQGRGDRAAADYLQLPTSTSESNYLQLTNGNHLMLTNGKRLVLRSKRDANINIQTGLETAWGDTLTNRVRVTVNPREEDDDATSILATMEKPLLLDQAGGPKDTTTFRLQYTDPDQRAQTVTSKDMQAPLANTDYTANTQEDGGGVDTTGYLSVVASYGATEGEYTPTNTYAPSDVYVIKLESRGRGIYFYAPIEKVIEDITSQEENHVVKELSLNIKYADDEREGEEYADIIIALDKDPRLNAKSVSFIPHRSSFFMMLFLYAEVGHKLPLAETQTGFDDDVFIQGISVTGKGNKISATYSLIEADRCDLTGD